MVIDLDMSQFHEIFFEESNEGMEAMESGLLNLDIGVPDPEVINTVFRAAHSIKGAAGTFGFNEISKFTHIVESTLDEVRNRKRPVTQELVDVLLKSVDCIRHMLDCSKTGKPIDEELADEISKELKNLPDANDVCRAGWKISFKPHQQMLKTGNDPYRLIREIESLGKLTITPHFDQLPGINELDPENCYLGWDLLLEGDATEEQIRQIFEWVEDECDLTFTLVGDRRRMVERRKSRDAEEEEAGVKAEPTSIRINIGKVDGLINLVGEMVITLSMLGRSALENDQNRDEKIKEIIGLMNRNTRELQEQAMRIRMLPIDHIFQRLPRLARDLCRSLGKEAELNLYGKTTEVDKTVLEKIGDPLVHLIRNAFDHGIETPGVRKTAGKPEQGLVEVNAYQEGGNIIIEINDDGAGLDPEKILAIAREKGLIVAGEEFSDTQIYNLIFLPGFSTATQVSDVSGRGVGMDVVKRNIHDLGGNIELTSVPGEGSKFTIRLPLTLAILDGQLVNVGKEVLIIPLLSIVESIQVNSDHLNKVAGKTEVYRFRDKYIPILRLHEIFGIPTDKVNLKEGMLIVVDSGRQPVGLFVNEVLGQQQVVIKSLETNFRHIEGLAGATVLSDGTLAMIIDVPGLVEHSLGSALSQHIVNGVSLQ